MKSYVLSMTMNILVIMSSFGEIKNGYEIQITIARRELKIINELVVNDPNLSSRQRHELKAKTRTLKNIIEYYELTEQLISLFRTISPDLYHSIDTIEDCKGRPVDVYIRFIPIAEMKGSVAGTTNISQAENDEDAYYSKYGLNTVSVTITAIKQSLILLAHEFGHISYQVPHLRAYVKFYFKCYKNRDDDSREIGHDPNDPSGQNAKAYVDRFYPQYLRFLKNKDKKVKIPIGI